MRGLHVVCKSLQASLLCKKADIRAKWDKMQGQDTVRKSMFLHHGKAGQGRAGTHSEEPGVMAHKGGC